MLTIRAGQAKARIKKRPATAVLGRLSDCRGAGKNVTNKFLPGNGRPLHLVFRLLRVHCILLVAVRRLLTSYALDAPHGKPPLIHNNLRPTRHDPTETRSYARLAQSPPFEVGSH